MPLAKFPRLPVGVDSVNKTTKRTRMATYDQTYSWWHGSYVYTTFGNIWTHPNRLEAKFYIRCILHNSDLQTQICGRY